jgi:hypothetical protein
MAPQPFYSGSHRLPVYINKSKQKGIKRMVLCVNVKTKIKDLVIEYIEVVLKTGEFVNLNWDYSEIEREEDGFSAFYRGVYFGEEKARDCISRLEDLSIACIGLYSEESGPWDIHLDQLDFDENGKNLIIENLNYDTEDGEKEVEAYCDLARFVREWLSKHKYDLKEYFNVRNPDDSAELGDLFDVAYDMKGDIEKSKFNPYPDDGRAFDDWYDSFIERLHTILRSIAYENEFGGEYCV